MKEQKKLLQAAVGLLAAFVLWTAAVCVIDVQPIGPLGSEVGFAALNGAFHALTGVHMALYNITDALSLIPLGIVAGFALWGLQQWIARKDIRKVDRSLLVLGGFYAAVLAAFALFEVVKINYRPVLIEGVLEASYPSSTTMLALCVMLTAILQLRARLSNAAYKHWLTAAAAVFTAFMVIGRVISGVHWITDIIGGGLLSAGLVLLYAAMSKEKCAPSESEDAERA